ncbi:MAG: SRPBCC family protein [Candidatus Eisenbacteria bacterium]|uniref:SRPBCC family protein n=1 Tax=Eiseniibacteriota bacterium TaxID=2212470 RepID=A0A849SVK5_UNCEI|nr:SRPBCC family protein [Candidatus Eisenbacteria bacterium]
MRMHRLETLQIFPRGVDEVFAFFADARNLERITPEFLRFRIVTPQPISMGVGTEITYALSLHGFPMRWVSRIDAWEPGRRFVDRQLSGPYARWVHEHTFEPVPGGTRVADRVDYALPLDPLSRPLHDRFVRPDVERIFAHRHRVLAEHFGTPLRTARRAPAVALSPR